MADQLLTFAELGERGLGSRWTIQRLINRGELKAVRTGAGKKPKLRVRESALEAFLKARGI